MSPRDFVILFGDNISLLQMLYDIAKVGQKSQLIFKTITDFSHIVIKPI